MEEKGNLSKEEINAFLQKVRRYKRKLHALLDSFELVNDTEDYEEEEKELMQKLKNNFLWEVVKTLKICNSVLLVDSFYHHNANTEKEAAMYLQRDIQFHLKNLENKLKVLAP